MYQPKKVKPKKSNFFKVGIFMIKYNFEFKKKVVLEYISERPSAKNIMDTLEEANKITDKSPYRRTFHSD